MGFQNALDCLLSPPTCNTLGKDGAKLAYTSYVSSAHDSVWFPTSPDARVAFFAVRRPHGGALCGAAGGQRHAAGVGGLGLFGPQRAAPRWSGEPMSFVFVGELVM